MSAVSIRMRRTNKGLGPLHEPVLVALQGSRLILGFSGYDLLLNKLLGALEILGHPGITKTSTYSPNIRTFLESWEISVDSKSS